MPTCLGALLFALMMMVSAGNAQAIELHRGVSLDLWSTWPDDARLAEPGFLDVFPEWRRGIGNDKIRLLRNAGFDFVRLTIDPFAFLSGPSDAKSGHLLQQTLETVAEIRQTGLKVIVDLHVIPSRSYRKIGTGEILTDPELFKSYVNLVRNIAKALSSTDPAAVAFEVMNEPTFECDKPADGAEPKWPGMLRQLYQAARAPAPKLTLLLSGACWGGSEGLVRLGPGALTPDMLADANVLWSFHTYNPFLASHQGASWSDPPMNAISGIVYPPVCESKDMQATILSRADARMAETVTDVAKLADYSKQARDMLEEYCTPGNAAAMLREPFEKVTAWAEQMHIPMNRLFLGEFGMIRDDSPGTVTIREQRARFMHDIRVEADNRGIAWAVWSYGGSFGITVDDDSRKVDPLFAEALGLPGVGQ